MNLLGNLGVDLWLLVAQIINFVFLLWILNKLVYKPLLRRIEADETALAEVKKAEAVLLKKEKQFAQKEKQYNTRSKNRAKAIIAEAEEVATTIKANAQKETKEEKKAVIAQIQQRLAEISHDVNK